MILSSDFSKEPEKQILSRQKAPVLVEVIQLIIIFCFFERSFLLPDQGAPGPYMTGLGPKKGGLGGSYHRPALETPRYPLGPSADEVPKLGFFPKVLV